MSGPVNVEEYLYSAPFIPATAFISSTEILVAMFVPVIDVWVGESYNPYFGIDPVVVTVYNCPYDPAISPIEDSPDLIHLGCIGTSISA